jgi:hypothetical protein
MVSALTIRQVPVIRVIQAPLHTTCSRPRVLASFCCQTLNQSPLLLLLTKLLLFGRLPSLPQGLLSLLLAPLA